MKKERNINDLPFAIFFCAYIFDDSESRERKSFVPFNTDPGNNTLLLETS